MPNLKQEVVVLTVSRYSIPSQETGELVEGTTVRYAINGDLKPYEEEDLKGYKLAKASLDITEFSHFGEVPGVYDADFIVNIASKDGKASIAAYNFEFKRSLFPKIAGK